MEMGGKSSIVPFLFVKQKFAIKKNILNLSSELYFFFQIT